MRRGERKYVMETKFLYLFSLLCCSQLWESLDLYSKRIDSWKKRTSSLWKITPLWRMKCWHARNMYDWLSVVAMRKNRPPFHHVYWWIYQGLVDRLLWKNYLAGIVWKREWEGKGVGWGESEERVREKETDEGVERGARAGLGDCWE